MKLALSVLATLLAISHADVSISAESMESVDSSDAIDVDLRTGDSSTAPEIVLEADGSDDAYCLKFLRVYEAVNYNFTCNLDCVFEEVAGSEIDLATVDCTATQFGTSSKFELVCMSGSTTLTLNFSYTILNDEPGVEYTITLSGYNFTSDDENAVLVIEQSLEDCSELEGGSSESVESGESAESEESAESDDDDDASSARRRLLESTSDDDDDDDDESSGDDDDESTSGDSESNSNSNSNSESSESSDEKTVGSAVYELTVEDGIDECPDGTTSLVALNMVKQTDKAEFQIVSERFDCELNIDPFIGVKTVTGQDGVKSVSLMCVFGILGVVMAYVF